MKVKQQKYEDSNKKRIIHTFCIIVNCSIQWKVRGMMGVEKSFGEDHKWKQTARTQWLYQIVHCCVCGMKSDDSGGAAEETAI